jgi:hypothetical protein
MIDLTPPARSEWHQVPAGEIHHGTFTDVYGFPYRPGWAFRCGDCLQVGVGYGRASSAAAGAERHRSDAHPSSKVVDLPTSPLGYAVADLTPNEWKILRARRAETSPVDAATARG